MGNVVAEWLYMLSWTWSTLCSCLISVGILSLLFVSFEFNTNWIRCHRSCVRSVSDLVFFFFVNLLIDREGFFFAQVSLWSLSLLLVSLMDRKPQELVLGFQTNWFTNASVTKYNSRKLKGTEAKQKTGQNSPCFNVTYQQIDVSVTSPVAIRAAPPLIGWKERLLMDTSQFCLPSSDTLCFKAIWCAIS